MKIIVDARTLGSRPSGIGMYLFDFIKVLTTVDHIHITMITDIAESEQINQMKSLGVPIICYGKRVFRSASVLSYFHFVKSILIQEQPDIFWEPNNIIPIKLRPFNGKIVVTIHDLFPLTEPENFSLVYRLYFYYGIKSSVKNADALIFNSNETKFELLNKFPLSHQKNLFTSYVIVPSLPRRNITNGNFFLYVGNLERRKGTDLLLDAYEMYLAKNGTLDLYLGGSIRESKIKKRIIELEQKTNKIHYLGYISENQKYDLLANCSCFIFPSRAEGFGTPPLEAFNYYKPVIISNLSIFKEILLLPLKTFDISNTQRACEFLCNLMLENNYTNFSQDEYSHVLYQYNSTTLGNKLIRFFDNIIK